jgi:hypothetical protein
METRLKEKWMRTEKSLRLLIEKWLRPTFTTPIRVIRFSHTRPNRRRYVCVEAQRPEGAVALFFFRHDDGMWYVFPPETGRLTMRAYANVG